jgi:putative copper export protein/methionine-rich copper-binding protein CopC
MDPSCSLLFRRAPEPTSTGARATGATRRGRGTRPAPGGRRRLRWVLAGLVAVLFGGALWAPHAAAANNTLNSSVPADGSTVATSPASLALTFANPLGQQNVVAVACNGTAATPGAPQVGADQLTLTVPLPAALAKGTCIVTWKVSNPDGTPAGTGTFKFIVTTGPATTAPATVAAAPGTAASGTPASAADTGSGSSTSSSHAAIGNGPLGVARLFSTLFIAVLFGSFVLISLAWPEGVEYILTVRFLRITYYLALISTVVFVICLTSQVTGKSFGASFWPTEWKHLSDQGVGVAALFRLVFTAGCAWVVVRPERLIDPTTQLPSLAVPGIAVASMGFSRSLGNTAVLGAADGIAHALAMSVWLGGLVLLARVVLAGPGESDLVHAVRGFSRISVWAIVITVGTGALETWRLDRGSLFSTSHGYVLLLKTAVVALMVGFWLTTQRFVHDRMQRAETMSAPLSTRLRRAIGLEAAVGVVVLVLSAWLLALTPAHTGASSSTHTDRTLGAPQLIRNTDNGVEVRIAFTQTVGLNAVRVDVVKVPLQGFTGLDIEFAPPPDSGVGGVVLTVPLTCECSAELPLASGVPLDAPGTWTITVKINGIDMGSKNVSVTVPGTTSATSTTIA